MIKKESDVWSVQPLQVTQALSAPLGKSRGNLHRQFKHTCYWNSLRSIGSHETFFCSSLIQARGRTLTNYKSKWKRIKNVLVLI